MGLIEVVERERAAARAAWEAVDRSFGEALRHLRLAFNGMAQVTTAGVVCAPEEPVRAVNADRPMSVPAREALLGQEMLLTRALEVMSDGRCRQHGRLMDALGLKVREAGLLERALGAGARRGLCVRRGGGWWRSTAPGDSLRPRPKTDRPKTETAARLVVGVLQRGPTPPGDIERTTGLTPRQAQRALSLLQERGEAEVSGKTRDRRYSVPGPSRLPGSPPDSARPSVGSLRSVAVSGADGLPAFALMVRTALGRCAPATAKEVAAVARCDLVLATDGLQHLVDVRQAAKRGDGRFVLSAPAALDGL